MSSMDWVELLPTVNYANHIQILPKQCFGPRTNPDYQIICVHRGTGLIEISDRSYTAQAGDFYIYGPHVVHKIVGDEHDPFYLSGVVFDLKRADLKSYGARDQQVQPGKISESSQGGIFIDTLGLSIPEQIRVPIYHTPFQLFDEVVKEYEAFSTESAWVLRGLMIQLLAVLHRSSPHPTSNSKYYPYYLEIQSMLTRLEKGNQLQFQTVQQLAQQLGFSPSYFYHIFKSCFGISPQNFLIQRRVHLAKRLLKQGHQSIEEISFQSGFGNIHYFNRVFRRMVGITPAVYRKQSQRI